MDVTSSPRLRWYLNTAPIVAITAAVGVGTRCWRIVMTGLYGWPVPRPDALSDRAMQVVPFFASFLIPACVALFVTMLVLALPQKVVRGWSAREWVRYTMHWGKDVYPH